MQETAFERILSQIASANQMSSSEIRERMRQALDSALENPDPSVQAMWESVPKKGTMPTLDEFMEYLIRKNLLLP